MSRPASHDPLLHLPADRIPEPTPRKMNETLVAAQQLFARQSAQWAAGAGKRQRVFFGRTWMEAILGAGLISTAFVLALVLSPAFVVSPDPQADLIPKDYFRRGMNPSPDMRPADLDMIADLEPYGFGDLRLGVRNVEDRFGIYFVQPGGVEQEIASGRKSPSESASISDAMLLNLGQDEVLLVRSGFGDRQRWEAFVHDGFGFAISGALSRQIWDATGREEALERLGGSP